ncbi:MAG: cytochrome C oxidase subunit IV family protein [Bacteroidota bacterium]
MSEEKQHITPYSTYVWILAILLVLTFVTVAVTNVNLGALSVTTAMLIASIKATLVLLYFMHLKFDQKIYRFMVTVVLVVFFMVIIFTFFDYLFR